jgi:RNA polymerase sigma factor (sigma-70 family)
LEKARVTVHSECFTGVEEIAELYEAHAVRVRRLVHLDVQAPDHVVEEACQIAWMRLVGHRARVRRDSAVRWLVRVARHEAWRQIARLSRDLSLEQLCPDAAEGVDAYQDAFDGQPATPDLLGDLVVNRARLDAIGDLPDRQRRLVWLQGLGFSYAEMAGATGDSRRTIERQLLRAKRSLQTWQDAA